MKLKILDILKDIKQEYINKTGNDSLSYKTESSCVARWVEELDNPMYNEIFSFLTIRQEGKFVIIKYLKYEVLFTREDFDFTEFFNMYDGLFRECRGLTIDIDKMCVVTLPFAKFFNINEMEETNENNINKMLLNADRVEFSDKLDGSLIITRYYEDDIFLSSSGMIEDTYIVKSAKKEIAKENYAKLVKDYPDWTLMFESIQPEDAHIVLYEQKDWGLHLIGMRNVNTGQLKFYSDIIKIAEKYDVMTTEKYVKNFHEIMEMRKEPKHSEKEGFVMNIDGYLIKIKCDDYLLMHKLARMNCSKNNIVKAVYFNMVDDARSAIPVPFQPVFDQTIKTISEYCSLVDRVVDKKLEEEAPKDRREFFAWVNTAKPKYITRYLAFRYLGKEMSFVTDFDNGDNSKFVKFADMEDRIPELKAILGEN